MKESAAIAYLVMALPTADTLMVKGGLLRDISRYALYTRLNMPWGSCVPEDLFKAFVLFPRVSAEKPVFYHKALLDILETRVKHKTMFEAALEINYWCAETISLRPDGGRTLDALSVLARGYGDSNEASVLCVCALRAVGIPARQVTVPCWPHRDGGDSWVEVWVDGAWHFMSPCEPEPILDSAWFTAAASKAMYIETKSYGVIPDGERVESMQGSAAILNRTAHYAETHLLNVRVLTDGQPAAGLRIRFELVNRSSFYPVCEKNTDEDGRCTFLTGQGSIHLHVHNGEKFIERMVDTRQTQEVNLVFNFAHDGLFDRESFTQTPPVESRIQRSASMPGHAARLEACAKLLSEKQRGLRDSDPYIDKAGRNAMEILRFESLSEFESSDKTALLNTLRSKDPADTLCETLRDALASALPFRQAYPDSVWREAVLCPWISEEALYPSREALKTLLPTAFTDARALWLYLSEAVSFRPLGLIPDAAAMLKNKTASPAALDVLFIACARACGIAARLDPVSGDKSIWTDEGWCALLPEQQKNCTLTLVNEAGRELRYMRDWSIGVLENGVYRTLPADNETIADTLKLSLRAGIYRVMITARQLDGSTDGCCYPVSLRAGSAETLTLTAPESDIRSRVKYTELPPLSVYDRNGLQQLPEKTRGHNAIYAFIAPGEEATERFLGELKSFAFDENIEVALICADRAAARLLEKDDALPKKTCLYWSPSSSAALRWRRLMNAGELRLPFVLSADAEGHGLLAFIDYNADSLRLLLKTFDNPQ